MAAGGDLARLPRGHRLVSTAQFRRVFRRGVRCDGPLFLMIAAENDRGHDRLGLAVSRRVGGAVERNRAKRLLRETFRRNRSPQGVDIVLLAKADIAGRTREEVEREFRQRLRRLASRKPGRGALPPAAH